MDILGSPFFDVYFGFDETVDDYVDRILYQLSLSLEEHIRPGRWIINRRPPPPPSPATSSADKVLRATCLMPPFSLTNPPAPSPSSLLSRRPPSIKQTLRPFLSLTLFLRLDYHVWEIPFDAGFVFDEQGRTDVLGSPFFDVYFEFYETVDDYVYRILYQLSLSLEEHIRPGRWIINRRPPPPPSPATSPADKVLRATCLTVPSLGLLITLLR
ncbi:hypothetical protein M5K25_010181 [Dendrobium thyrsiflorum]|uniref:Uncharacterized protein n=1 Tax=Dendrobium thyrsiflorum TaxID=117978 RepID=A0ABD0V6M1_DENTH